MILYGYWRSSSSWRVRIALHHKQLAFENRPVHLVRDGGEHRQQAHTQRNPMAQVPVLELHDGTQISQSMAILEYLEETSPARALLPLEPTQRARARMIAEHINSGIQPLQNLSLVQHVVREHGADKERWMRHFIGKGMDALEALVHGQEGPFLVGDALSYAEILLIPQLFNARRWGCNVDAWPTLLRAEGVVSRLPAFQAAHPDRQPDAA